MAEDEVRLQQVGRGSAGLIERDRDGPIAVRVRAGAGHEPLRGVETVLEPAVGPATAAIVRGGRTGQALVDERGIFAITPEAFVRVDLRAVELDVLDEAAVDEAGVLGGHLGEQVGVVPGDKIGAVGRIEPDRRRGGNMGDRGRRADPAPATNQLVGTVGLPEGRVETDDFLTDLQPVGLDGRAALTDGRELAAARILGGQDLSGREPEAQGRRLRVDRADELALAPSGQPRIGLGADAARVRLPDAGGDGVEREVHPGGPHFLGERAEVRLAPGKDRRVDVDMRVLVRPEGVGSPDVGEEVDLAEVRPAGLREPGA